MIPRVFIGSSEESYEIALALKNCLDGFENLCVSNTWKVRGFFEIGGTPIESLARKCYDYDFAVLIVSGEDRAIVRKEEGLIPRQNIIFELGLFIGAIGRKRTIILFDRDEIPKLPSDLEGVTRASFSRRNQESLESAISSAGVEIKETILNLGVFLPCLRLQQDIAMEKLIDATVLDRVFGLFWRTGHQIYPITIKEILKLYEANRDGLCLTEGWVCLKFIERELRQNEEKRNIDLGRITDDRFALPVIKDLWGAALNPTELDESKKHPSPKHKGNFPESGINQELIWAWSEMRRTATELLEATFLSPYRIVLSYSDGKYMTITCSGTSKEELAPYFHTPIVETIDPDPGYYYGSPSHKPSSETNPHWVIHEVLHKRKSIEKSAVVHAHPILLMNWLESAVDPEKELPQDGILPHERFGTRILGEKLGRLLVTKRSSILLRHGVWTAGENFDIAFKHFLYLMEEVRDMIDRRDEHCREEKR